MYSQRQTFNKTSITVNKWAPLQVTSRKIKEQKIRKNSRIKSIFGIVHGLEECVDDVRQAGGLDGASLMMRQVGFGSSTIGFTEICQRSDTSDEIGMEKEVQGE